ncbi:MAG: MFS transporter, partial [Polaromonas sp.]
MIRRMWLVTFVDFCYGWSLWVFLTWLPSYLKDARGFDMKQLALFTALPLLAGVVGDTLGGVLSDRIYKKTGNLKLARRLLLVVGLGGALVFIVPAIYTNTPLMAVALLAASFFFLELTNAVLWSLPLDIAGKFAGTAGGMMNTGFGVAGMVSPVAFGYLIQTTGSYEIPFLISAVLLGVAAVCSLWIDPTNKLKDPVEEPQAINGVLRMSTAK